MLFVFFFYDTGTTVIYTYVHTLSLLDALPIFGLGVTALAQHALDRAHRRGAAQPAWLVEDQPARQLRGFQTIIHPATLAKPQAKRQASDNAKLPTEIGRAHV